MSSYEHNTTPDGSSRAFRKKGFLSRDDHRKRTHERRRPSSKERRREQALIDWYGPARGREEIAENRASFEKVGDVLKDTFSHYGLEQAVVVDELQNAWEEIVGTDVSRVTRPSTVKGSILDIEVTHPAWLYVLQREHKKTLEQKLQKYTENTIINIRLLPAGRSPR